MRDKFLAQSIGRQIRFDLSRGPSITGRLVEVDFVLGQAQIQIPRNSPSSIAFVQLKHVVRLEIFPD